jgi:hypothetical protein
MEDMLSMDRAKVVEFKRPGAILMQITNQLKTIKYVVATYAF